MRSVPILLGVAAVLLIISAVLQCVSVALRMGWI
jgi:hypothetical protein